MDRDPADPTRRALLAALAGAAALAAPAAAAGKARKKPKPLVQAVVRFGALGPADGPSVTVRWQVAVADLRPDPQDALVDEVAVPASPAMLATIRDTAVAGVRQGAAAHFGVAPERVAVLVL